MSPVRTPRSIVFSTALSIAVARSGRQNEYFNIMPIDSIIATGLTMPLPDMSGAEPYNVSLAHERFSNIP